MTSLFPLRSTAITSCAPQSENQRRPSCQRGDSPIATPVKMVFNSERSACLDGIITSSSENYSLMRVSIAIQFTSQVFPPSSENDCSKRCDLFNSVRRDLEHPSQHKRDRQTDDDEQNNQTNYPVWNIENRQDLSDSLRKCPP